ncbi:unnamed protein product [marine sediment metagenome]|uniref:Uncharacterized protein n=1 Tax=marine sediment metagenome TaxID=412755 RepID=X0VP71_9ZZZZ
MNTTPRFSKSTLAKRRHAKLQSLAHLGPFVAGSLNKVERKDQHGNVTVYHLLTFKQDGKTRSVHVPKDMVKEVGRWIRNYRAWKKRRAEISELSVSIIRRHVPEKRAAAASKGSPVAP